MCFIRLLPSGFFIRAFFIRLLSSAFFHPRCFIRLLSSVFFHPNFSSVFFPPNVSSVKDIEATALQIVVRNTFIELRDNRSLTGRRATTAEPWSARRSRPPLHFFVGRVGDADCPDGANCCVPRCPRRHPQGSLYRSEQGSQTGGRSYFYKAFSLPGQLPDLLRDKGGALAVRADTPDFSRVERSLAVNLHL